MNTTNEIELRSLLALAEKYGSPLYVYDTQKITSQYQRITRAFTSVNSLQLNYAVKALSNISILKFFKQLDSGLDTVSIQEVQLGLAAGFNPKKIIYTPNGVSLQEFEKIAGRYRSSNQYRQPLYFRTFWTKASKYSCLCAYQSTYYGMRK